MDCQDYITDSTERKKGQHLRMVERGAIKALKQEGLGIRAIAKRIGCAPSTVTNEHTGSKEQQRESTGLLPNTGKNRLQG